VLTIARSFNRNRWRSRAERLSAGHPISIRLAPSPWNGWSRLHQLAHGVRLVRDHGSQNGPAYELGLVSN